MKLPKNGTASVSAGIGPSLVVDGNYEQRWTGEWCARIDIVSSGQVNWWQFTFDFDVLITSVEIYNCGDGHGPEVLNNALVEVYNANQSEICGETDFGSSTVTRVTCQKVLRGNGVRITIHPDVAMNVLFCEVDFYGRRVWHCVSDDYLKGMKFWQESNLADFDQISSRQNIFPLKYMEVKNIRHISLKFGHFSNLIY